MLSYLISFVMPGGQFGFTYGSHVAYLPEAPSTDQVIAELRDRMAKEYSAKEAVILGWDYLPGRSSHPSGVVPYSYYMSYAATSGEGISFRTCTFLRPNPLITLEDLRSAEEMIRSSVKGREVRLMSCKALTTPDPKLLQDYEQCLAGKA